MMNFFGGKRKSASPTAAASAAPSMNSSLTSAQGALQKLKQTLENLDKRVAFTEKRVEAQKAAAIAKSKAGDKRGALFALKKKKLYEGEIEKLENVRITLETQIIAIEGASMNEEIVGGMNIGQNAMKGMMSRINPEKIATLKEDIQDTLSDANEVNDLLGEPLGEAYDDDDLMNELNELETNESLNSELEGLTAKPVATKKAAPPSKSIASELNDLPDVPQHKLEVQAAEDDDARALAALEEEMAL